MQQKHLFWLTGNNCFHRNSSSQRFLVYRYGHNPWKLFYQVPLLHSLLITPSYFPCAHCSHSRLCCLIKSSCVPKLIATQTIKQNVKKTLHKSLEQWELQSNYFNRGHPVPITAQVQKKRIIGVHIIFVIYPFVQYYNIKSVSLLSSFEAVLWLAE